MSRNRHKRKNPVSLVPDTVGWSPFLLKMASVSEFMPVRRELIKNTPPKPFLIGVAGGSASGKVKVALKNSCCNISVEKGVFKRSFLQTALRLTSASRFMFRLSVYDLLLQPTLINVKIRT